MFSVGWWCVVRMSATPLETRLLRYVQFWVDSDGVRSLYLSWFGPVFASDLWAASGRVWLIPCLDAII